MAGFQGSFDHQGSYDLNDLVVERGATLMAVSPNRSHTFRGDTITLDFPELDTEFRVRIADFVNEPLGTLIYMDQDALIEAIPYTRAIAHHAGWQWRIPLQHRNGNGLVYSSSHCSDDEAADILLNNLDSKAIGEPRIIRFRTGRTRKQWHRNVVAVGLSSGFLEPLESTSIYLIQSAVVRLIHLFPHTGVTPELMDEYNRQSQTEYELIRDFIILHYYLNERNDTQFWRDLRQMDVPERITRKNELFRANGGLQQDQLDIFLEPSWLQVMLGQGVVPRDYHPLADALTEEQLREKLSKTKMLKNQPLAKMPGHDQFLEMFCKSA